MRQQTTIASPIAWVGNPWSLAGRCIANFALVVLTLGLYAFWARTDMRRRLWSSVRVLDEPLVYTGNGRELCTHFTIVALGVVLPTLLVLNIAVLVADLPFVMSAKFAILAAFVPLVGLATYSARRYRLSRTLWRGRPSGMTKSARGYAWLTAWTAPIVPLTLGWLLPWRDLRLRRQLVDETVLAGSPTRFEGPVRQGLYPRFALLWFSVLAAGVLPLVGLFWLVRSVANADPTRSKTAAGAALVADLPWLLVILIPCLSLVAWAGASYAVRRLAILTAATRIGDVRFRTTARTLPYAWLIVSNLLITYGTFTALRPVAEARRLHFLIAHLVVEGDLGAELEQTAKYDNFPGGDGFGQLFDIDLF